MTGSTGAWGQLGECYISGGRAPSPARNQEPGVRRSLKAELKMEFLGQGVCASQAQASASLPPEGGRVHRVTMYSNGQQRGFPRPRRDVSGPWAALRGVVWLPAARQAPSLVTPVLVQADWAAPLLPRAQAPLCPRLPARTSAEPTGLLSGGPGWRPRPDQGLVLPGEGHLVRSPPAWAQCRSAR